MNSVVFNCKSCRTMTDVVVEQPANLICQRCGGVEISFNLPVKLKRIIDGRVIEEHSLDEGKLFDSRYWLGASTSHSIWTISLVERKKDDMKPVMVPIEEEKKPILPPKSRGLNLKLKKPVLR